MDKPLNSLLPAFPRSPQAPTLREVLDPLKVLFRDTDAGWELLNGRAESFQHLFDRYVYFLAAIPAVSGYVGFCIFGSGSPLTGLASAISTYILSVVFMYAATVLAHRSVRMFDGQMSLDESAKLVIYSLMPFFLTGAFLLLPALRWGSILGVSSLYLFYKGMPRMARVPFAKQHTYFLVNVVSWIIFVDACTELLWS